MSYRNPKILVDTQSGQHVRDMMQSVTDSYSKFAATEAKSLVGLEQAKAEKAEIRRKEALKEQQLREKQAETRKAEADAKAQELSERIISQDTGDLNIILNQPGKGIGILYKNISMDKSNLSEEDRLRIAQENAIVMNAPEAIAKGIASLQEYADFYEEAHTKNSGEWGSIYQAAGLRGEDGKMRNTSLANDILIGYPNSSEGTVEGKYDYDKGVFSVDIKDKNGEIIRTFTPNREENMEKPQIVPNLNKQFVELDKEVAKGMNLGDPTSPVYEGQPDLAVKHKDGVHYHKFPSKEAYKKAATPLVERMVGSMEAGDLIALYNKKLNPKGDMEYDRRFTDKNDPRIATIREAMVDFLADQYGNNTLNSAANFGAIKPKSTSPTSTQRNTADTVNNATQSLTEIGPGSFDSSDSVLGTLNALGFQVGHSDMKDGTIVIKGKAARHLRINPKSSEFDILSIAAQAMGLTPNQASASVKRSLNVRYGKIAKEEIDKNNKTYSTSAERIEAIRELKNKYLKEASTNNPMGEWKSFPEPPKVTTTK